MNLLRQLFDKYRNIVLLFCCLILLVLCGYAFRAVYYNIMRLQTFYAVFLDNGQVYFGKVSKESDKELVIYNVFYLKATTDLASTTDATIPDANLSLVKLGSELYKPRDRMFVNRSHVLFLEEMKAEGDVIKAIKRYEETKR